jgi:outer membrane protein assembly factor BamB
MTKRFFGYGGNLLKLVLVFVLMVAGIFVPVKAQSNTIMGLVPMWSGSVGKILISSVISAWGFIAISYTEPDGTCKIRCLDQFIGRDVWPKPLAIGKGMIITQMEAYKNLLAINIANPQGKETKMAVIDLRNGKTVWKLAYEANDRGSGNIMSYSPRPYYDYLYIGLGGGRLVCYEMQRGDFVFDTKAQSSTAVFNAKLLAASRDGVVILSDKLQCFDPENGKLLWTKPGSYYMADEFYRPRGDQQFFTVLIDSDAKYIEVMKVKNGEVVVRHKAIGYPIRQPIILYGKLYYPCKDLSGKIHLICMDIAQNKVLWGHAFVGLDTFSWWGNDGLVGSVIRYSDRSSKVSLLITSNGKESGFFGMGTTHILAFCEGMPYMTVFENVDGNYNVRSYEVARQIWPEDETELRFRLDLPSAFVNGKYRKLDVPAQRIEGFVCLPLRFIIESIGGSCIYDPKTGKMGCIVKGQTYEFWAGKHQFRVNGKWYGEDPRAMPFLVNGTMMIPLYFSAFLGLEVELYPFSIWQVRMMKTKSAMLTV